MQVLESELRLFCVNKNHFKKKKNIIFVLMLCLGLYVALFFSVSTGVSLSHAAWLSWCFGLYATWGFVSLLQVDDIWRRRRSWDRRLRFALLACFALAGFVCAIGAGKAKSFLFVFFSLLAYDMLVWILKGFFFCFTAFHITGVETCAGRSRGRRFRRHGSRICQGPSVCRGQ